MTTITRESAEIKSFITGFLSDPAHDAPTLNPLRRVFSRAAVVNTIGIRLC